MGVVARCLFTGLWRVWAQVAAESVSVGARFWPLVGGAIVAAARARRACLAVLIGVPVVAGWPLLYRTQPGDWLHIAVPWWILLGVTGLMIAGARACDHAER